MLFSTIHNQSKASELIERAKEVIENTHISQELCVFFLFFS